MLACRNHDTGCHRPSLARYGPTTSAPSGLNRVNHNILLVSSSAPRDLGGMTLIFLLALETAAPLPLPLRHGTMAPTCSVIQARHGAVAPLSSTNHGAAPPPFLHDSSAARCSLTKPMRRWNRGRPMMASKLIRAQSLLASQPRPRLLCPGLHGKSRQLGSASGLTSQCAVSLATPGVPRATAAMINATSLTS